MTAIVWPSATPILGREVDGVRWVDGKPRCTTHAWTCFVKATAVGVKTDGGTHVCPGCMREYYAAKDSITATPETGHEPDEYGSDSAGGES